MTDEIFDDIAVVIAQTLDIEFVAEISVSTQVPRHMFEVYCVVAACPICGTQLRRCNYDSGYFYSCSSFEYKHYFGKKNPLIQGLDLSFTAPRSQR